jgi:hypothetical protein
VSVYVGSAQIAADTLGLPLGQVRVLHGSTPFLTLDNFRLSPGKKDFTAPQLPSGKPFPNPSCQIAKIHGKGVGVQEKWRNNPMHCEIT